MSSILASMLSKTCFRWRKHRNIQSAENRESYKSPTVTSNLSPILPDVPSVKEELQLSDEFDEKNFHHDITGHIDEILESQDGSGWTAEHEDLILRPYNYIASLPQKQVRNKLLIAANQWFKVDPATFDIIAAVIGMLHDASLMIDDVQDQAELRRGAPAAHQVYSTAEVINSANYVYFLAQKKLSQLPSRGRELAVQIFNEEVLNLHRGQGLELYWRETFTVPSEAEYINMALNKTGGLFRLAIRLLQSQSDVQGNFFVPLINTMGLIFQILDDYKSLSDHEMASQKGYCEDLSEGKFSFTIIHGLKHDSAEGLLEMSLRQKPKDNATKAAMVRFLQENTGSFQYTRQVLDSLHTRAKLQLAECPMPNSAVSKIFDELKIIGDSIG